MRLFFLLVRRVPPVESPVLAEVYRMLQRRGFEIEVSIAEEGLLQPEELIPEHDLVVLKSHTELSLSLAGILHAQGARILNPYPACAVAQNKIVWSRQLRMGDVPVPRSWVTADPSLLLSFVEETPLIVKPYLGHRGAGIRVISSVDELRKLELSEAPVLFQEFVEGPGEDLKIYVIGDEVFGVRKRFSSTSFARAGRACEVTPEVRQIALQTGRILGLGLYGLDLIEGPSGPVVIDVNYFPGYKGVAEAPPLIADFIEGYATGEIDLTPAQAPSTSAAVLGSLSTCAIS